MQRSHRALYSRVVTPASLLLCCIPALALASEPRDGAPTTGEDPKVASDDSAQGGLSIEIEERDNQTVVKLRRPAGQIEAPKIATSRRGFMLTFDGEQIEKQHHRTNAWRLGEVIAAQYDDRAVLRLVQRKGRPGPIDDHVRVVEVDGGLDLFVIDRVAPPTLTASPSTPGPGTETETEAQAPSVEDTVAALQAALEPPATQPPALDPTLTAAATATPSELHGAPGPGDADTADAEQAALDGAPAGSSAGAEADPAAAGFAFGEGEGDDAASAAGPTAGFATWTLVPSILALLGLGLWMRRRKQVGGASALEVVSKTALGPRQQIVQVKVDGRALLLGVTEHQIGLITELAPAETATRTQPFSAGPHGVHHEFGSPFPPSTPAAGPATGPASGLASGDDPEPMPRGRIEAFKARLAGALRQEVSNNRVNASDPARPSPSGMEELRALLGRHETPRDPAWTREEVA